MKAGTNNKWIKIGSKYGTFLSRYNSVYKAINKYMKAISGMPKLLDNYKYIEHIHYGSESYPAELKRLYQRIHKKMGGVVGYIKLRKNEYRQYIRRIKDISIKVNKNISNSELIKLFLKSYYLYGRANSFLGLGTLYTDFLTRELQNKYGDELLKFDFSSKTKLSQYHKALIKLSKIRDKIKREKEISKILKKYFWIGSFFFIGNELSKKQILKDIKNIKEYKGSDKRKTLPCDPLVQEMKKLSKDRNDELEEFMLGEYYFRRLLYEIARRIGISFETLNYLSPDEIIACLKGRSAPYVKIRKRRKLFGFLIKNGKVHEYEGRAVKFLIEKQTKDVSHLEGVVTYSSRKKIRGLVKIVLGSADIKKVKKGNILVTIMTTPNYIQAIYNASAIVTDEGGITSHAAIISRELRIPCIIGTKLATKILKDGDKVMMDMKEGVIRKI